MENGIVKAALETSNNILLEIYGDLLKPGVSQVGHAIGTLLGYGNTLLMPLALKNERSRITIQNNLNKYKQKLESIPEENIQAVIPEIGVPILEKLMYVSDETLIELYTELLAKASDKEQCESTHPSFVNTINNLSPKEVLLMERINSASLAFVDTSIIVGSNIHPLEQILELALIEDNYDKNYTAYISNLAGLGLIEVTSEQQIVDTQIYQRLEELIRATYIGAPSVFEQHEVTANLKNGNIEFTRGLIKTSNFGTLFLTACTKTTNKSYLINIFHRLKS